MTKKFLSIEWIYSVAAFLILFLLRYPTVILGLDVTDEGYNLSNQFLAGEIGIEFIRIVPQWWFSDFVGACWLKVMGDCGLWGARFGGILLSSLIAMLSVRLISFVYKPHLALLITLIGAALYSQPSRIIYYDSVPLLLFVLCGCFFIKMLLQPSELRYALLTGATLAALLLSKWPMMTVLGIPILILYFYRAQLNQLMRSYLLMYGVVLICITAFFLYLLSSGVLGSYLSLSGLAEEHNKLSLQLFRWYWQLRTIVPLLLIFFGVPLLCYLRTKQVRPTLNLFVGLLVFSMLLSLVRSKWFCPFMDVQVVCILTYLFCGAVSFICIFLLWKSVSIQEFALFLFATLFPLEHTLGSAAGLGKAPHGMWLLAGVMLCLLLRLGKQERFTVCNRQLLSVSALLTLVLGGYGIQQGYFYMGRDCWNLSALTSELTSPRLRGIYTTPERQKSFDALIAEMSKYAKRGDYVLAYSHLPMIYFASATRPLGDRVWSEAFLSPENLEKMFEQFSSFHPPVLIVKANTDTFNPSWGVKPLEPFGYAQNNKPQYEDIRRKQEIFDRATNALWDLHLIWSNADFELFTAQPFSPK